MINCNPETVSTDYDTSDRLYFEPLTVEDVLEVVDVERPEGVIVQFGGQTPLRIAGSLQEAGVKLLGTPVDAIDLAEDRGRFGALLDELGIQAPPYGVADDPAEAIAVADRIGFPLLVRPSYVLGGRAMEICYSGRTSRPTSSDSAMRSGRAHVPAAARPLPRERDRVRRRRALPTARTPTSRGSCSTSRRPASTPATPPACCRRSASATRCSRRSAARRASSRCGSASSGS